MESSPGTGGKDKEAENFFENFLQISFQGPQKVDVQELLFMLQ